MNWYLAPRVSPESLGFIPSFLSREDEAGAQAQLHRNYIYGGFQSFPGFTLVRLGSDPLSWILAYPEDPPVRALAYTRLREETIILFQYSWVAVVQPDFSFTVARMD
jgi:hypothetical protein